MAETFEAGELKRFAAELERSAGVSPAEARRVVQKGALNIKNDARRRISGHPHLPAYPYAITYDTKETPGGSEASIGPDKDKRQGPLGNVLEYGSPGRPPIPHMIPAAETEQPKFEQAMQDLAVRLLEGR